MDLEVGLHTVYVSEDSVPKCKHNEELKLYNLTTMIIAMYLIVAEFKVICFKLLQGDVYKASCIFFFKLCEAKKGLRYMNHPLLKVNLHIPHHPRKSITMSIVGE